MRLGLDQGDHVCTEGSISDYGERAGKETGSKNTVDGWVLMGEASGLSCRAGFSDDGQGLRSTCVSRSACCTGLKQKALNPKYIAVCIPALGNENQSCLEASE